MAIERGDVGKRVASPCVRNCCLDDDDICLGCFRTLKEICAWSESSDEQRVEILKRCGEREAQKRAARGTGFPPSRE
ncbi:MAG TPA: DUF1289 domain-containing protein [Burkholderiales bacterium]|nr:DUF1289 domain-containing protein [Burkholderiales bacterium]